jgi:hypothetical protein
VDLHRGINFSRLEVPADAGGALFVAGSLIALLVGLPAFRWFLLGALLIGGLTAVLLYEWHSAHPEPPLAQRARAIGLPRERGNGRDQDRPRPTGRA